MDRDHKIKIKPLQNGAHKSRTFTTAGFLEKQKKFEHQH